MNHTFVVIELPSGERTKFDSITKAQSYVESCKTRHPSCLYRIEVK